MSDPAPSATRVLRKLYLTLFLRGRSSRGLQREGVPKSVASKLALTLVFYALFGLLALQMRGQGAFMFAFYLHGMSLLFIGMFIASSSGEVLFNKEEAEILLHRPIRPRALLWAKVSVLLQVSLLLACAFNLSSFIAGAVGENGSWIFPLAHLVSTVLAGMLCCGGVVLLYQLCLRWFGRERLENLMTGVQVLAAIGVVLAGQAAPYVMKSLNKAGGISPEAWWVFLCPPAWFSGLDQVLMGHLATPYLVLGAIGVTVTLAVCGIAFLRLARDYESGLQTLNESRPARPRDPNKRRFLDRLIEGPPLSWLLRDPVTRAAFRLTGAYMFRDREMKLRLYPGLAPVLILPFVFLLQGMQGGSFGVIFAGSYLALLPLMALTALQYSQQWQACDLFRAAPVAGPGPFITGARRAVMVLLVLPALVGLAGVVLFFIPGGPGKLALLLPGIMALPVFATIPGAMGQGIPLALPSEEAKAAGRGLALVGTMLIAMAVGGVATFARSAGWFYEFLAVEAAIVAGATYALHTAVRKTRWAPAE